jgi:hypothetical protein
MPKTLHDAFHKSLINEEAMNSGGQGRNPSRPTRKMSSRVQEHQTPFRQTSGHWDTPKGTIFMTPW